MCSFFSPTPPPALAVYTRTARRAAGSVIKGYSTSFSLATGLLAEPVRTHITNLYAVVRIADEIVDGTAAAAGLSGPQAREQLDGYCAEILAAIERGFSTDLNIHAFATTARACGMNPAHITAFFDSMRADIDHTVFTPAELERYIYGSAEVIGLMCLDAFVVEHPLATAEYARAQVGARALGAAFQKINFLRDLGQDSLSLGRSYFGTASGAITEADKDRIVADIRGDLAAAYATMGLVPLRARAGVLAAYYLFDELTTIAARTPAAALLSTRITVPGWRKALLSARALRIAPTL